MRAGCEQAAVVFDAKAAYNDWGRFFSLRDFCTEVTMRQRIVLLLIVTALIVALAGCGVQVNNPVGGMLDGIARQLSGIGDSISRMVENMTRGIRFGP